MGILVTSFLWVLHASITASIAALLIILISKLFSKYIGVRLQHALWIIIVIKLIIPLQFQSNLSLFNLLHEKYQSSYEIQNKSTLQNMAYNTSDFLREGKDYWNYKSKNQIVPLGKSSERIEGNQEKLTKEYVVNNTLNIASCIWLAGVISAAIFLFIIDKRFKRKILNLEELKDLKFMQLLEQCKKKVNINVNIPVYVCDSFKSPCILGVFKPKIYIPRCICGKSEYKQLYHVLLHELIHYKRKDLVYNSLAVLAVIMHWFNPIIWFCMRKMKLQRECACDAYVLETIGEEEAEEYGMALINFSKMVSNNNKVPQLAIFFETKNQIIRRIEMIKNFKKGSYRMSAAAIACCVVASGVVLTGAVNAKSMKTDNIAAAVSNNNLAKKQESKVLIDSQVKMYLGLKRAEESAGFKLKVPDFIPQNYMEGIGFDVIKVSDKDNVFKIEFYEMVHEGEGKLFQFQVSKENMEEVLKKEMEQKNKDRYGKKCEITKEPMNLAGINGSNITIKSTFSKGYQETSKFFAWQDEGLWYSIEYKEDLQDSKGSTNTMNISTDDVAKVAASIKYVQDVKNVKYCMDIPGGGFDIYDKEDLRIAKERLGFNPKILLKVNKSINIEHLSAITLEGSDNANKEDKHEIGANYNYHNGYFITFVQAKKLKDYEDIKKNGYVEVKDENGKILQDGKIKQEKAKILNISNKEVFKYEYSYGETKNEPVKLQNYVWKEDGFYCKVVIKMYDEKLTGNLDELAKEFVNSKPID
ncbi:M56 family metallopeptidase [Clostridium sp. OS1-26]|uniref:M56 family metallopeptidase n=1 Tax=Clostridium sp. OS1-26 TaxID=3070681 RepID=UPI0027E1F51B|nr:M56 family metallopeptidase [Clostridium sp. OS1-26]WML33147.1 M56 family metallopeptidase [Clostridium sp. OS1-26]